MSKKKKPTMTEMLRVAIRGSGLSAYRISQDTGLIVTSILRFLEGETSLRLDKADVLAEYLGFHLVPNPDAVLPEPTPENLARPMLTKRKARRTRRPGSKGKKK
jgi:hypothetical protein